MDLRTIHLIAMAVGPAVLIIAYVYLRDKYDREPLGLLAGSFLLGCLSVLPAILLESILPLLGFRPGPGVFALALYSVVVIGFSEEYSKYLFFCWVPYRSKAFNEPFDGIMYALMVSMGFATVENLMYVFSQDTFEAGLQLARLRAITAVPAHAAFAVIMGYYAGKAKFSPQYEKSLLAGAVVVPALFHGAYDFFLLMGSETGLAIGAFVALYMAVRFSLNAMQKSKTDSHFLILKEKQTKNKRR